MKRIYLSLLIAAGFISCSEEDEFNKKSSLEANLRVNHYTVDCLGVSQGSCLLVQEGEQIGTDDWYYFYFENSIEGFEFEPGYIYNLVVKKITVVNPAEDASSIIYKLIETVSKEKNS